MQFSKGDYVVYEYIRPNDGRKYICYVIDVVGDWVVDINAGSCLSASFRPADVIIWEHRKKKG